MTSECILGVAGWLEAITVGSLAFAEKDQKRLLGPKPQKA